MKRRKRSKSVRLMLIGGLSAGALAGCDRSGPGVSTDNVYTNNYYVPHAGYYHAPFHAWYEFPYNHFDARTRTYYYGGQWSSTPYESIVNISAPSAEAVSKVQAAQSYVSRGGFGSTSGGHGFYY